MKATIIIPTYNEKGNIGPLIEKLQEVFSKIKNFDMSILIVDGNSPDGTGKEVKEKQKKYKNIKLLVEKKKGGLGAAYIHGFKYALKNMSPDVVFEMDADFQHDPEDIPRFLEKIQEGYDYVLGSRYVKGGSIPKGWGIHRKILSRFGSVFARYVLGTRHIKDYTTGYKATRVRGFLDRINLSKILSKRHAYKIHLLYEMLNLGAKTVEIPISFKERQKDHSKSSIEDLIESLKVVCILRYRKNRRFIRVCIVGAIGAVVQFTLFFLLKSIVKFRSVDISIFSLSYKTIISAISVEAAILVNFFINNLWTFADKKITSIKKLFFKLPQFNFLSLGSIVIQAMVMEIGTRLIAIDNFLIDSSLICIGILLGLIWNFTMYTRVVWKTR